MKAVAYRQYLPVDDPRCLLDIELPDPVPTGRDLLVRAHAESVNPVDTKVRRGVPPDEAGLRVLGFDAAGVVEAVGTGVTLFAPGDAIWYAGSLARPGTNAERHLVDERLVGPKPRTLDFAQAAAMPLTTITAWEALFDRLGLGLGAHVVIDHAQPLSRGMKQAGIRWAERIFSVSHTHVHFPELAAIVAPQGRICVIDDPEPIDVRLLKARCASLHWEAMFARSAFGTPDMGEQGRLLGEVAAMVDEGLLSTTHADTLGPIDAATLRTAHTMIESGRTVGKWVLAGF
jgi:NADPH2:quinone reductase